MITIAVMSNYTQALRIIKRLRQRGHQALLAGGCVRDKLLGRSATDYDVATSATPNEVLALFRRTLKVGARFGVVIVMMDNKQVEVATFRTEGGYQDGRRPNQIAFASMQEDAERRDFTVNGMFYDPIEKKLYDFVGGQADVEAQILRTIGNPDHRFSEDYLRMLRAIRFAVKLNFTIEPNTWQSIQTHAGKIAHISAERIAAELEEIITHPNRRRGVELLLESGLARAIFPDYSEQAGRYAVKVVDALPRAVDFGLAMAAFCAGLSTETAIALCRRLKLSNADLKHICFLLTHRGLMCDSQMPLSRLKLLMHEPGFEDLTTFQKALLKAEGKSLRPLTKLKKRIEAIDPSVVHPKPLLDGHDLIALGAVPGPMVGRLARELYFAQLDEHLKTPAQARQWAVRWLEKHKSSP